MTKKLDESAMQSELAGSAFFSSPQPSRKQDAMARKPTAGRETASEAAVDPSPEVMTPRHRGPVTPGPEDNEGVIEAIRRAVHQLGKEDATYRFTDVEKKALADIVYTYGSRGIRTSQNEITRIAINWLVQDYRANGIGSVLARVLERLNA